VSDHELIAALDIDGEVLDWRVDALCTQTDPELFFPEKGGSTRRPKAICAACPVAAQCLAYALETDQRYGIWGGMSERERRQLMGRRAVA
jgi:WhiB family redox-sensing transcriptional regulator